MSNATQSQGRFALSVEEAAQALGLSRATIYRLIRDNRLATLKVRSRRIIPIAAIDAILGTAK
jgi:excisionase family DNA binding protein